MALSRARAHPRPLDGSAAGVRRLVAVALAGVCVGSALARAQDGAARDGGAAAASGDGASGTAADGAVAAEGGPRVVVVDEGELVRDAPAAPAPAAPDGAGWGPVRSRQDVIVGWAPRYRLVTARDPLGLEQELWRRIDVLPLYHRVSLDATYRFDESTSISLHTSAWGTVNLLEDAGGGLAAGDVAIGYVELRARPVELWVGRRFLPYGPPGGVHVDGGGAAVRTSFGLFADAFVGRPVTPTRTSLLGPSPSFEGATIAYGARVGYSQPGLVSAAASYAELWAGGLAASRTIDVSATGDPGPLHVEGALKLDVERLGVLQASLGLGAELLRELSIDGTYLHVEPGRWIPAYSILSVFETTTFDEAALGATLRPMRALALRVEAAGRLYTGAQASEPVVGYRVDVTARLAPTAPHDPSMRVLVSRRDDGTVGYTLLEAGGAFDVLARLLVLSLDGALAVDDAGSRLSLIARTSLDATPRPDLDFGGTVAFARTPFAEAEIRALLRARWTPEAR